MLRLKCVTLVTSVSAMSAAVFGMIDTCAYGKLDEFSGEDSNWQNWSFVTRSHFALISETMEDLIANTEQLTPTDPLDMVDFGATVRVAAKMLEPTSPTFGEEPLRNRRASVILHPSECEICQESCDETLLLLCQHCDRSVCPRCTSQTEIDCCVECEEDARANRLWLRGLRRAVVERIAQLNATIPQSSDSSTRRTRSRTPTRSTDGRDRRGAAPMDAGGIENKGDKYDKDGKKGKDSKGGKGKKGKGGQKGKGGKSGKKGKTAWSDGGKNGWHSGGWLSGSYGGDKGENAKAATASASGGKFQTQKFDGNCSFCWKYGFKCADCRQNPHRTTAAVEGTAVADVTAESTGAFYYDLAQDDSGNEQWVAGISRVDLDKADSIFGSLVCEDGFEFVFFDSSSDDHVCGKLFGGNGTEMKLPYVLKAITGYAVHNNNTEKQVDFVLETFESGDNGLIIFQVEKVMKNVFSAVKRLRAGYRAHLDLDTAGYLQNRTTWTKCPIYIRGNSTYFKVIKAKSKDTMNARNKDSFTAPIMRICGPLINPGSSAGAEDLVDRRAWEEARLEHFTLTELRLKSVIRPVAVRYAAGDLNVEGNIQNVLKMSSKKFGMQKRLKDLNQTHHGDKRELWARLQKAEAVNLERKNVGAYYPARAEALLEGQMPYVPVLLTALRMLIEAERGATRPYPGHWPDCDNCDRKTLEIQMCEMHYTVVQPMPTKRHVMQLCVWRWTHTGDDSGG